MYSSIAFIVLLLRFTQAQDANCDFYQNVAVGSTYYISSPNYPNNYRPNIQCRWIATCPSGYNCRVDCTLNMPQSPSCSMDRVLVSTTGDPQLTSADYYCGMGTVTAVSTQQDMSIGLIVPFSSQGGKFICTLTAQRASTPQTCNCGYRRMNRIVGGEDTKPNEYPMMAGIVDVAIRQIKCGAVIISKNYVITAGHCMTGKSLNEVAVVVGEHDTTTGTDSPAMQVLRVASYLVHPQYKSSNYDYDIAIVRVGTPIVFSEYVGPVCLPFKFVNRDFAGDKVTILGWGTQFVGGPTSNTLKKVDVDVISQTTCQRSVSDLTLRQMCTFTTGKDACQDDSGGPLLYTDPATGRLFNAGIVSFGRFCASRSPSINTRITALLNWIVTNAPDDYCRI